MFSVLEVDSQSGQWYRQTDSGIPVNQTFQNWEQFFYWQNKKDQIISNAVELQRKQIS